MSQWAEVDVTGEGASVESLFLELKVTDPDLVVELSRYAEGAPREEFALTALRIGMLALRQARGQLDAGTIERECDRMLTSLEHRLETHSQAVHQFVTDRLREYFDPQSGRFEARVRQLFSKDGDLEQVLRRQVGERDSELARTLVNHVGQQSPLFKLLSPDESQGIMASLGKLVATQLQAQSDTVLRQFSLDNQEGALARMIRELSAKQGQFSEALAGKIQTVVREFSLDEENSALSRLVRNVSEAQRRISSEFSLDNEQSALSRLKGIVEKTDATIRGNLTLDHEHSALSRLKRELLELLKEHQSANIEFQTEVKTSLAKMITRREEADRSTRHGLEFEEAVCLFLDRHAQSTGDIAERTGATTGLIRNCKVGDALLTLGADSAAAGARIVVEAKEVQGYTLGQALAEIDQARKNRDAQVGLFLLSKRTAPELLDPVARHGSDVIVVWDAEDAATDLYFRVGLTLAKALCIRAAEQRRAQAVDFSALDAAVLEVAKRSADLDKLNGWSETIRGNSDKIMDHVRIARTALDRQVKLVQEHLSDLKQSLAAEA